MYLAAVQLQFGSSFVMTVNILLISSLFVTKSAIVVQRGDCFDQLCRLTVTLHLQ